MTGMNDEQLDRLLAAVPTPTVSPALARRVLADFERQRARWTVAKLLDRAAEAVWPDAPLWQPACAFAAALLLGLGLAAFAPLDAGAPDETAGVFAFSAAPDLPQDI